MRRLVLLGLLGLGVSACKEEPLPLTPQEEPLCPELVIQGGVSAPSLTLSTTASALRSTSTTDADGRQRVLVRFRKPSALGVTAAALPRDREDKVRRLGAHVKYNWPHLNAMALSLTPEEQAQLAKDPDVLSISVDRKVHALGGSAYAPVAALLGERQPMGTTGSTGEYTWALRMVQANEVWDANNDGVIDPGAVTGAGIKVCVIDSGIDPQHRELAAAYAGGRDYVDGDDNPEDKDSDGNWGGGHGTHVAGTIVAQLASGANVDPNNTTLSPDGMVGVAPGATLLVARVLDTRGNGDTSDVIEAMKWCQEQGARIASLSLGSSTPSNEERDAFAAAWSAGMLSVAASGNSGESATPETRTYPAAYDNVISVGAVDSKEDHPKFSQGGDYLSLVAPGVSIYSTFLRGQSPYSELQVGSTFFRSGALDYVPFESYEGKLIDCGLGDGLRSCPNSTCEGFVAYVDRGEITFADKVKNVRSQGARAVIIGNNDPDDDEALAFTLTTRADWPPVAAVPTTSVADMRGRVGTNVRLSIKGSDYSLSTGTSMATPHVAGVAALVWSAKPGLTNAEVKSILESSAKDLTAPANAGTGHDIVTGFGLVQAKAAVQRAISQ